MKEPVLSLGEGVACRTGDFVPGWHQIRRFQKETGCDHFHLVFGQGVASGGGGTRPFIGSFEEQVEMLRLFGREVMPASR